MNKQAYQKPAMRVVKIQQGQHLLTQSLTISKASNNVGFKEDITSESNSARARRQADDWDDWDE